MEAAQPVAETVRQTTAPPRKKTTERARAERVNPGYRLGRDYPEFADGLLIALTERRTKEHIDRLAELVGAPARAEVGV